GRGRGWSRRPGRGEHRRCRASSGSFLEGAEGTVLVPRAERQPGRGQVLVDEEALAGLLAPEAVLGHESAGRRLRGEGPPSPGEVEAAPGAFVFLVAEERGEFGGGVIGEAGKDDLGPAVVPDGLRAFPAVAEVLLGAVLPDGDERDAVTGAGRAPGGQLLDGTDVCGFVEEDEQLVLKGSILTP